MIILSLHLIFKFKHGAKAILISFLITVALILLNYGIKLSTGTVFH
jgi:hypothetical protein